MSKKDFIANAIFNYVHIKTPTLEYKKVADPKKPHINKEYIVDVLMPYAAWKKFKKAFKNVGAVEKAKTYTAAEYKVSFKVDAPDAEVYADEDGDYTIIKFRQRAYYKDSGDVTKQPNVVGVKKIVNKAGVITGYRDANGLEFDVMSTVGNGSSGMLQYNPRTWSFGGDKGLNLDLVAIQIKHMIPYVSQDHGFDMDEEESGEEATTQNSGDEGFEDQGEEQRDVSDTPESQGDAADSDDDSW